MVDVCVLGPSKSFLQEALVRDLDLRTHQAMTSCSISPYGYGKPPRRMTSRTLRGGGPVLKRE
jgi:hypothetical protein